MNPAIVLVVEDEALVATHLEACLKGLGYEVYCAATGEEALEVAAQAVPQLALMDIRLAGAMDGIDAAIELRRRHGVPCVFLTAYADDATIERAKRAEPVGYLVKPFRERELRATIEVALRRVAIERRLREREQWHHAILDSLRDPVILTDVTGRVSMLNRAAEEMTGWQAAEARGVALAELFTALDQGQLARLKERLRRALREKTAAELGGEILRGLNRSGGAYSGEAVLPMVDEGGVVAGAVLVFRQRGEPHDRPAAAKPEAAQPETQSPSPAMDPQTGLPGRAEAEHAIAQAHRQGSRAFVAVFVLDHFKTLIQRYGYTAAEEVLLFFSVHLAQGLGAGAHLFRWSGPAFVILAERLDSLERVRREMAALASVKLEKVLELRGRTALVVISAAWEVYPIYGGPPPEQLVRQIDAFAAAHCW